MSHLPGHLASLPDDWLQSGPDEAERLLTELARRWKVLVTVHDLAEALTLRDGTRLLPAPWFGHRHPVCRRGRAQNPHVERCCLDHCWKVVNARASQAEHAFRHRCWRGQQELVIPIHDDGIHCLTLFLNPHGPARAPAVPTLPERLARTRCRALLAEAHLIGHRLIRIAEEFQGLTGKDPRQRTLRRLLAFHSQNPIDRATVATALGVSPSRASHVVQELFGKSWRRLLAEARLERAKRLLRQESLKVAQVAALCGYSDPNTFHRAFRKAVGLSPRRWRQARLRHLSCPVA
jgi:AraC-like DNA-binding protein